MYKPEKSLAIHEAADQVLRAMKMNSEDENFAVHQELHKAMVYLDEALRKLYQVYLREEEVTE